MKAEFSIRPELHVLIESEPGGVRVAAFHGVCYEHSLHAPDCRERSVEGFNVDRQTARAIASAMMGCASRPD